MKREQQLKRAESAILHVQTARGFLVESQYGPIVVTAAHCLPRLPAPLAMHDATYPALLGPLGDAPPTVSAECLFADPVADLAVLMSPDPQELFQEADAYDALMESLIPLSVRAAKPGAAWVLGLDRQWFRCDVQSASSPFAPPAPLWMKPSGPIVGGMSGSPIIQGGAAIGLVSRTSGPEDPRKRYLTGQQDLAGPCLACDLPCRLLPREVWFKAMKDWTETRANAMRAVQLAVQKGST